MSRTPFDFVNSSDRASSDESFLIDVPQDMRSKDALMTALARAGRFPDYFGFNWDALSECLRDWEWIAHRRIVIVHKDLPLLGNPADCRIYLEILRDAVNDWAHAADRADPPLMSPDHELRVCFPRQTRRAIDELLGR